MKESIFTRVKNFMNDPSGIKRLGKSLRTSKSEVIDELREGFTELKKELAKPMDEVVAEYQAKIEDAENKAEFYCMSLNNIGDVIPDMLWFKYIDGKYAYANKAIKDGLLFDETPVGKDDHEIGFNAIERFGIDNHDFGAYCAGSDTVTISHGHRKRFIEYGVSGGIPLVLEVFKNVVIDSNKQIIGTVGSGRDITELIFTMISLVEYSTNCGDCSLKITSAGILDLFLEKYLFEDSSSDMTLRNFYNKYKDIYNER